MCSTNSWEALVWCNSGSYYHVHVSPSVCLTVFSALLDCLSDIYSSLCLCHSLPLLPLKRSPSVGPTSKGRRVSTITCALWSQWVSLNMLCCPRHCWCLICVCVCVCISCVCLLWLSGCMAGVLKHLLSKALMCWICHVWYHGGVAMCIVCVFFIFILYSSLCSLVNGHAWCMGYACCGSNEHGLWCVPMGLTEYLGYSEVVVFSL